MGSEAVPEPHSTPKLSFFSLPKQSLEPPGTITPPMRPPASVPFLWEEAPGKPRTCPSKPLSARCLDLPPRLLEIKIPNLSSPTTVLDGPYVGRSDSYSSTAELWFKRSSPTKWQVDVLNKSKSGKGFFGKRILKVKSCRYGKVGESESFSSLPLSQEETKVKITRFKRNESFLNINTTTAHLWASIRGSLKQVVHWRLGKSRKDGIVM